MKRLISILIFVSFACGSASPKRQLDLYPSPTINPTQTQRIVIFTQTPDLTSTPIFIVVSQTPTSNELCVSADEAVWLRPSPSIDNYPIVPVANGTRLHDLGGRVGSWDFVALGDKRGWIYGEFLKPC